VYTKVPYFGLFNKMSCSGCILHSSLQGRDMSVHIVTIRNEPEDRGVGGSALDNGKRCSSTPWHPDRHWGVPSLLFIGYCDGFLWDKAVGL
jgi:hypothetical protein